MSNVTQMPAIRDDQKVKNLPRFGDQLVEINNLERRLASTYPIVFCHKQGLTAQERSSLGVVISHAVNLISSKQEPEHISYLFITMVESMKTAQGMDVKSIAAGYKIAVSDVAGGILEAAITNFIKGHAQGYSVVFLPTPAELRQYCEKMTKFTQSQITYAQSLLAAPEEPPLKRVNREQLMQLAARIKQLA